MRSADTEYLVVIVNNAEVPVTLRVGLADALAVMSAGTILPPELGHRLGLEQAAHSPSWRAP